MQNVYISTLCQIVHSNETLKEAPKKVKRKSAKKSTKTVKKSTSTKSRV